MFGGAVTQSTTGHQFAQAIARFIHGIHIDVPQDHHRRHFHLEATYRRGQGVPLLIGGGFAVYDQRLGSVVVAKMRGNASRFQHALDFFNFDRVIGVEVAQ